MLAERVRDVLRAIAARTPQTKERHRLRRREFGYFGSDVQRMRYGTFVKEGYPIGSGVVEAACEQVVAQRLDQAGMPWGAAAAEAIVRLRGGCARPLRRTWRLSALCLLEIARIRKRTPR